MNKPFDPTRPCQTRDKRKVRILCIDGVCDSRPIVGFVDGCKEVITWNRNGRHCGDLDVWCDLVNIPEKRKYWVVIVRSGNSCHALQYDHKVCAADTQRYHEDRGTYIATHEGEYEVEASC